MLRQKVNHQERMINWDINNICRVCLTENENMKILFNNEQHNEICEKIEYCTLFKIIYNEDKPLHICLPCLDQLEVAFNFKQKFENSTIIIQNKYDKRNVNSCDNISEDLEISCFDLNRNVAERKSVNEINTDNCVNNNVSTNALKSKYLCNICGYLFTTLSTLKSHLITHNDNQPYSCHLCGKKFKSRASKSFHLKSHSGERKHFCNQCGRSYFNSSGLKYHMRSHETNKQLTKKLFTCKECNKSFKSQKDLITHIILHSGDFPFVCDICGHGFNRSNNYKTHMRRHSGIKTFICDTCGFALYTSSALNIHKRSHTSEKPYTCEFCDGQFATSSSLNKHKKRLHTF